MASNGSEEKYFEILQGFDIDECYLLGISFLKEKDGKAFHVSYEDKLKLIAYSMQVKNGPFDPQKVPDTGLLDVVGRDRKAQWQLLDDMSKVDAQKGFLDLLDVVCPLFKSYMEAHRRESDEKERQRLEAEAQAARDREKAIVESSTQLHHVQLAHATHMANQERRLQHEAQIRNALNQQTIIQFRQYAEQQHPNDKSKQDELIGQLQEQHFQQYVEQVYQEQLQHQKQVSDQTFIANGWTEKVDGPTATSPLTVKVVNGGRQAMVSDAKSVQENATLHTEGSLVLDGDTTLVKEEDEPESPCPHTPEVLTEQPLPSLMPASMWTRRDIAGFKAALSSDKDAVIKIGSGEVVTVRVPTHEEGSCIFWEFATDSYDLGFGVFFEWGVPASSEDRVTVHVTEALSEEEEEVTEKEDDKADGSGKEDEDQPQVEEIVPVYRRECQEEVYCGSHQYPGHGVYLLKFDNSYSLWRSKWLYYRVYYTR